MQTLPPKTRRYRTLQTPSAFKLPFPIHPQIRFAQLAENAPAFGLSKAFRPESSLQLEGFHPNVIVGTASELGQLAEQVDLGIVNLSGLDHAVVVLTRCGNAPVNDVTRVIFWQAFGVPVYEVFTGFDDAILGIECELHEGWHIRPGVRLTEFQGELMLQTASVAFLRTGLTGFLVDDACPCGRAGQRLLNIEPVNTLQFDHRTLAAIA